MSVPTMAPPNGHTSLIGKAATIRVRPARRRAAVATLGRAWRAVQPVSLSVAALGCAAGAAWTRGLWAGLLATGAALLVLEWRITK